MIHTGCILLHSVNRHVQFGENFSYIPSFSIGFYMARIPVFSNRWSCVNCRLSPNVLFGGSCRVFAYGIIAFRWTREFSFWRSRTHYSIAHLLVPTISSLTTIYIPNCWGFAFLIVFEAWTRLKIFREEPGVGWKSGWKLSGHYWSGSSTWSAGKFFMSITGMMFCIQLWVLLRRRTGGLWLREG
jgi:hypothetical protein